ncbi:MAG: dienelactone hydrolase family protein [Deltaproteobacteria bacterium]|jgi:dienelactone hydrolase
MSHQVYPGPDGRPYEGFLATPATDEPRPLVVLGHDWSGINAATRAVARRVASYGYACFAIDAYGQGVRGDERGDNAHLMDPVLADRDDLRARLLAGYGFGRSLPSVRSDRVATLGFCFGGICALDLARARAPGLLGTISVHGGLRTPTSAPRIDGRVLLLHGWADPIAPPEDVVAIARELTDAGADWELRAYGHAMHAFTFEGANQPEAGIAFHPTAATRAWDAIEAFLGEVLGP